METTSTTVDTIREIFLHRKPPTYLLGGGNVSPTNMIDLLVCCVNKKC